jgi:hypothetical protein
MVISVLYFLHSSWSSLRAWRSFAKKIVPNILLYESTTTLLHMLTAMVFRQNTIHRNWHPLKETSKVKNE